jgi:hypothetical protein
MLTSGMTGLVGGAGRLFAGTVESIEDDAVIVVSETAESTVRCAVLRTSDSAPPVPVAGDEVLVWQEEPGGRACIVGVFGRPAEPAPGIPDELVIEAGRSLTLKVGDGSITIREDGRILIRGNDLVSHAKRNNRIRGGSVTIN